MNELEAYQTSHGDILLRRLHDRDIADLKSKEGNITNLSEVKAIQDMVLSPVMKQLELMNKRQMEFMEKLLSLTSGQLPTIHRGSKWVLSLCVNIA